MTTRIARRLVTTASGVGGFTVAAWLGAAYAVAAAFFALVLAVVWVLSDDARTDRLVRLIRAPQSLPPGDVHTGARTSCVACSRCPTVYGDDESHGRRRPQWKRRRRNFAFDVGVSLPTNT
jgi:hypothetical protein